MTTQNNYWRALYDRIAASKENFLEISGREQSLQDSVFKMIFQSIDEQIHFAAGDVVLDVGCGTATISAFVAKKASHVVAADTSLVALRRGAEKHPQNRLCLLNSNALSLPFKDSSFDKILAYSLFLCFTFDEADLALRELLRVLKPNGAMFIGDQPEIERERNHYRSRIRRVLARAKRWWCHIRGKPALQVTWYARDWFQQRAKKYGLRCRCFDQRPSLPYAYYRFDVLLEKNATSS